MNGRGGQLGLQVESQGSDNVAVQILRLMFDFARDITKDINEREYFCALCRVLVITDAFVVGLSALALVLVPDSNKMTVFATAVLAICLLLVFLLLFWRFRPLDDSTLARGQDTRAARIDAPVIA